MKWSRIFWLAAVCATSALAYFVSAPTAVPAVASGTGAAALTQVDPSVAAVGATRLIIAWSDYRSSGQMGNIWATAVDLQAGRLVANTNNVQIGSARASQNAPDVACGPTLCLISWQQDQQLLAVRVDASLNVLDSTPLVINECVNNCINIHAAWDGASWLTAYWDVDVQTRRVPAVGPLTAAADDLGPSAFSSDSHIATDGTTTLVAYVDAAGDLVTVAYTPGTQVRLAQAPKLASPTAVIKNLNIRGDPTAGYVAVWVEGLGNQSLNAIRVAQSGSPIPPIITIAASTENNLSPPAFIFDGGVTVAYWDTTDGMLYENTINLSSAVLGTRRIVGLGGYKDDYTVGALPSGEHAFVDGLPNRSRDIEVIAIDNGALRVLDAGAYSPTTQVDAVAAWAGTTFVMQTFEELGPARTRYAYAVSATGVVGPNVPMPVNDDFSLNPRAAPNGTNGVAVLWASYGQMSISATDSALTSTALQTSALPAFTGFDDVALTDVGGHPFIVTSMFNGACLVTLTSEQTPPVAWSSACAAVDVQKVAVAASTTQQFVAVTRTDGALFAFTLPLIGGALDAGVFLSGQTFLTDAGMNLPIVPAVASDGTNALIVWWHTAYNDESVSGALMSPGGQLTRLAPISQRAPHQDFDYGAVRPFAVFDGVRYWVAYQGPAGDGGIDAFVRPVDVDGSLEPEQVLASTGYDQTVEALAAGTPGRVLALTRSYDVAAGAQRMAVRILAEVPPGAPCFALNECGFGQCTSGGTCPALPPDAGTDGGVDAGASTDAGSDGGASGDGGFSGDGGMTDAGTRDAGSQPMILAAGCGCHSTAAAPLTLVLLVLRRRRR